MKVQLQTKYRQVFIIVIIVMVIVIYAGKLYPTQDLLMAEGRNQAFNPADEEASSVIESDGFSGDHTTQYRAAMANLENEVEVFSPVDSLIPGEADETVITVNDNTQLYRTVIDNLNHGTNFVVATPVLVSTDIAEDSTTQYRAAMTNLGSDVKPAEWDRPLVSRLGIEQEVATPELEGLVGDHTALYRAVMGHQ